MFAWLKKATDSDTLLGNVTLCGLLVAVLIIWGFVLGGCAVDDRGLAAVAVAVGEDGARMRNERPPGVDVDPGVPADVAPVTLLDASSPDTVPPPADMMPALPPPDTAPPPDTTPPSPCATLRDGAACGPQSCVRVFDGNMAPDYVRSYVCRAGACVEERFDCTGLACDPSDGTVVVAVDGCDPAGAWCRPRRRGNDIRCPEGSVCKAGARMCTPR